MTIESSEKGVIWSSLLTPVFGGNNAHLQPEEVDAIFYIVLAQELTLISKFEPGMGGT